MILPGNLLSGSSRLVAGSLISFSLSWLLLGSLTTTDGVTVTCLSDDTLIDRGSRSGQQGKPGRLYIYDATKGFLLSQYSYLLASPWNLDMCDVLTRAAPGSSWTSSNNHSHRTGLPGHSSHTIGTPDRTFTTQNWTLFGFSRACLELFHGSRLACARFIRCTDILWPRQVVSHQMNPHLRTKKSRPPRCEDHITKGELKASAWIAPACLYCPELECLEDAARPVSMYSYREPAMAHRILIEDLRFSCGIVVADTAPLLDQTGICEFDKILHTGNAIEHWSTSHWTALSTQT